MFELRYVTAAGLLMATLCFAGHGALQLSRASALSNEISERQAALARVEKLDADIAKLRDRALQLSVGAKQRHEMVDQFGHKRMSGVFDYDSKQRTAAIRDGYPQGYIFDNGIHGYPGVVTPGWITRKFNEEHLGCEGIAYIGRHGARVDIGVKAEDEDTMRRHERGDCLGRLAISYTSIPGVDRVRIVYPKHLAGDYSWADFLL